jgi:hypothetical protein
LPYFQVEPAPEVLQIVGPPPPQIFQIAAPPALQITAPPMQYFGGYAPEVQQFQYNDPQQFVTEQQVVCQQPFQQCMYSQPTAYGMPPTVCM